MARIIYTGSYTYSLSIGNVINEEHLSYLLIKTNTGNIGDYSTAEKRVEKNDNINFSIDNLPSNLRQQTYILSVKPIWFGDSRTYTEGNYVDLNLDVRQYNNLEVFQIKQPTTSIDFEVTSFVDLLWDRPNIWKYGTAYVAYISTPNAYSKEVEVTSDDGNLNITYNIISLSESELYNLHITTLYNAGSVIDYNISVVDPQFIVNTYISKGGKLPLESPNVDLTQSEYYSIHATYATIENVNGQQYVYADNSGNNITIDIYNGPNGIYGQRSLEILVEDNIQPTFEYTIGNTGDTVSFELEIGKVKLKGISSLEPGTTLTEQEINTAFTTENCRIISVTTDDGITLKGIIHLNGHGGDIANITANYEDNTTISNDTGVKTEDIILILN